MVTVAAVGDVRIHRDDPDAIFAHVRDLIRAPDIAFCQSESSYSDRGSMGSSGPRGASPRELTGYPTFAAAGFKVVSMASNHTMDWGRDALLDSIQRMRRDGMHTIGAGEDIDEARRPAILDVQGLKVAFLGYCSVAPKGYYAVPGRAGVAPMRAITHYEALEEDQPGTPAKVMTWPLARDLEALVADVRSAQAKADAVVVSFHWGVHFIPVWIADYQPVVAHAVIDAGADAIIGHHPHVLKAIEVYRGKPIFYSLGNFAHDSHRPGEKKDDAVWRKEVQDTYRVFGTSGPGEYRNEKTANYSMIANMEFAKGGIVRATFRPVVINDRREPRPLSASEPDGTRVVEYVESITRQAGMDTGLTIDGDEALIKLG
jgi:poly-gamma-glutamate capsule biosynthesis protein CapA/YwtB (metallophosphatase superfamily)